MQTHDFANQTDLLGSTTPNLYTPLLWAFGAPSGASRSAVVDTLTKGLAAISEACPYLAAQIDTRGALVPYLEHVPLIVKDIPTSSSPVTNKKSLPTFETLKALSFPVQLLEGSTLLPLAGLPSSLEGAPRPVLIAQVNFLEGGGLLLCIAGEHTVMDGGGLAFVLTLLDQACRGEALAQEDIATCNMNRIGIVEPLSGVATHVAGEELRNMTPGKGPDELLSDPKSSTAPPQEEEASTATSTSNTIASNSTNNSPANWGVFRVTAERLKQLKDTASAALPEGAPFISTNDAVTALLWQRIMCVRTSAGILAKVTATTFSRAIDMRNLMGLQPTYPGNMTLHTYTTIHLNQLLPINPNAEPEAASSQVTGLADAAFNLRKDLVNGDRLVAQMRSLVTVLLRHKMQQDAGEGGAANMSLGVGLYPGANLQLSTRDLILSSWAAMRVSCLTFGLQLGTSLAVRRPLFMPLEGLLYILPMQPNGDLDLLLSLSETDFSGLRSDQVFGQYAEWIG